MGRYRFGKSSRKNMSGVRVEIILLATRVIAKSEFDFGIPRDGGFRTAEDQQRLYNSRDANGNRITKADGIKKLSYHQSGNALDIFLYHSEVPGGRAKACWKCYDKYKAVADLFKAEFLLMQEEGLFSKEEELVWGGDWKWKDRPHFQISLIEKLEDHAY